MLPIFQTTDRDLSMLQTAWASVLNPLADSPLAKSIILTEIDLVSGDNIINHKLGRKLQGWWVVRMQDAFVQLYDKQSTNLMQDKTLILNSSGSSTINLVVF